MAIQHPEIQLGISTAPCLERIFAEEALRLLSSYVVDETTRLDNTLITFPVTDFVEMYNVDESQASVAMRLIGTPVITTKETTLPDGRPEYFVIELRHAELSEDKDGDLGVLDRRAWCPYIMTVISTQDPDNISVLSANTGEDLDNADLGQALFTLQAMRDELRGMHFEDTLIDPEMLQVFARPAKGYVEFDSAEYLELSDCETCGTENVPCSHNPSTLS